VRHEFRAEAAVGVRDGIRRAGDWSVVGTGIFEWGVVQATGSAVVFAWGAKRLKHFQRCLVAEEMPHVTLAGPGHPLSNAAATERVHYAQRQIFFRSLGTASPPPDASNSRSQQARCQKVVPGHCPACATCEATLCAVVVRHTQCSQRFALHDGCVLLDATVAVL
jgi:hypothetical protein